MLIKNSNNELTLRFDDSEASVIDLESYLLNNSLNEYYALIIDDLSTLGPIIRSGYSGIIYIIKGLRIDSIEQKNRYANIIGTHDGVELSLTSSYYGMLNDINLMLLIENDLSN